MVTSFLFKTNTWESVHLLVTAEKRKDALLPPNCEKEQLFCDEFDLMKKTSLDLQTYRGCPVKSAMMAWGCPPVVQTLRTEAQHRRA